MSTSVDEKKDDVSNRIKFIKNLINSGNLKPIIDFDNMASGESRHDIVTIINNMNKNLQHIGLGGGGTTGHTFRNENTF